MSDQAPADYITFFKKTNTKFEETLRSHLIGDPKEFGIIDNNFEIFLKKRAEFIENEFRNILGLRSKTEQQFEKEPSTPIDFFEISMRSLLNSNLQKEYGDNYWKEAVPIDVQQVVANKINHELQKHPYEYSKFEDSSVKINFLDIMDYLKIILSNWSIFKNIFGSKKQLEKHFLSFKEYRNLIKHVKPTNEIDKKNGEAAILWFEKIFNAQE
jgi:hypothetical protein